MVEHLSHLFHDYANLLHRRFQETGNPAFAWKAISVHLSTNRALPKWVLGYLASAADGISDLLEHPPENRADRAVLKALGMDTAGQGNVFSRASDAIDPNVAIRDMRIEDVVRKYISDGHKLSVARQLVADEFGVSEPTVRRILKRRSRS